MSLKPPRLPGGPWIMGVLNVTPDSFSDGGRWGAPEAAVAQALALVEAGADVIDVGGESTRPGAALVGEAEELARVAPVIERLARATDAAISIDTMKPAIARAAFAAGATIWNDVAALTAPGAIAAAGDLAGPVILMHSQGGAPPLNAEPAYGDVVAEVIAFLQARVAAAEAAGARAVWIDPGIGFSKTLAHNLALMRALGRIKAETGRPLLFGASRKSFIAKLDPGAPPGARLGGSIAAALAAVRAGADMVRVHDVAETRQALLVARALADPAEVLA